MLQARSAAARRKIDAALADRIRECARRAYRAVGCRDYARIDLRLGAAGEPCVVHVQSQEILARTGSFAAMAAASGLSWPDLAGRIVEATAARSGAEVATRPLTANVVPLTRSATVVASDTLGTGKSTAGATSSPSCLPPLQRGCAVGSSCSHWVWQAPRAPLQAPRLARATLARAASRPRAGPMRRPRRRRSRGPGFGTLEFTTRDGKRLRAQVYRPSRFDPLNGSLWFVMHGVDRDAARYIGAAAPVAERHQALAIVIEFSRREFPDTDDYTLGITTRGRADESASREGRWRAPEDFVYNELERVFEAVRRSLDGAQRGYHLLGHSAGAQFTHRLLTFMPCARVLGAVAANAGWYTLPAADAAQPFGMPYSLRGSAPGASDPRALLAAPLTLLLGTRDTSEAATDALVRGTPGAQAQGRHRLARGHHISKLVKHSRARSAYPLRGGSRSRPAPATTWRRWSLRPAICCSRLKRRRAHRAPAEQAQKLLIHEVLADPPPGPAGDANRDGQRRARDEQFVEILNNGSAPLCLAGWTLEDASGRGGHLSRWAAHWRRGTRWSCSAAACPPAASAPTSSVPRRPAGSTLTAPATC